MKKEEMENVLRDMSGKEGFRVPEGYFDRLPERVMERIRREEALAGGRVVSLQRRKRLLSLAAAAAIALLFVSGFLLLQEQRKRAADAAGTTAVTAYLMPGDFDEQTLYDFMEEENIDPGTLPVTQDDDQIIDYLVNEGVDESLLAELY